MTLQFWQIWFKKSYFKLMLHFCYWNQWCGYFPLSHVCLMPTFWSIVIKKFYAHKGFSKPKVKVFFMFFLLHIVNFFGEQKLPFHGGTIKEASNINNNLLIWTCQICDTYFTSADIQRYYSRCEFCWWSALPLPHIWIDVLSESKQGNLMNAAPLFPNLWQI